MYGCCFLLSMAKGWLKTELLTEYGIRSSRPETGGPTPRRAGASSLWTSTYSPLERPRSKLTNQKLYIDHVCLFKTSTSLFAAERHKESGGHSTTSVACRSTRALKSTSSRSSSRAKRWERGESGVSICMYAAFDRVCEYTLGTMNTVTLSATSPNLASSEKI